MEQEVAIKEDDEYKVTKMTKIPIYSHMEFMWDAFPSKFFTVNL